VRDLDWSDVVADGERMTDQQQFLMELDRHDNTLAEIITPNGGDLAEGQWDAEGNFEVGRETTNLSVEQLIEALQGLRWDPAVQSIRLVVGFKPGQPIDFHEEAQS